MFYCFVDIRADIITGTISHVSHRNIRESEAILSIHQCTVTLTASSSCAALVISSYLH